MARKSHTPGGTKAAARARVRLRRAGPAVDERLRFSNITAQRRDIHVVGARAPGIGDLYHRVLTLPWWGFFVMLLAVFLCANGLFAFLYSLDPGGVAGARTFADDFFFSVETLSTIGYGAMTPRTLYANGVMTAEAFSGLGLVAVATGLIFARVSRPTARIMFSRIAVVAPFDGLPALMFRAANQRGNQILEAEASVSLFRETVTLEGQRMRRFQDLKLERARQMLFTLTWTLIHRIDEASPLHGLTPQALEAMAAEIVVAINGVDEVFGQRIYARHGYLPDEILFDREFADVLLTDEAGRRVVNYNNFHDVKPRADAGFD
ncbi:MAG TPA: ion channel [Caulobacteraceae bacterium]|nr:ion channel [Caulobacteraceae bacterium]